MIDVKLVCPYCGGDRFIREITDVVEIIQTEGDGSKDEVVGDNLPSLVDAEYDYKCEHCKMGLNDKDFISKKESEFALIVTIDRDDRPNTEILYFSESVEKIEEVLELVNKLESGYSADMKDSDANDKILSELTDFGIALVGTFEQDDFIPKLSVHRIVRLETVKQF